MLHTLRQVLAACRSPCFPQIAAGYTSLMCSWDRDSPMQILTATLVCHLFDPRPIPMRDLVTHCNMMTCRHRSGIWPQMTICRRTG